MKNVAVVAGVLGLGLGLGLGGCANGAGGPGQTTIANLTTILNTSKSDLTTTVAVAQALTPPDTDGAACAQALMTVQQQAQAVLSTLPAGSVVGVFTTAEIASVMAPGSAQFNSVVKVIETGCVAKLHDVMQAGAATAGLPAALAAAMAITLAPGA